MVDGPSSIPGPMPSSFDNDQEIDNERPLHKLVRKIKEEPLVPLGMGLTALAFVNAYRALRRGDSKQANRMFRARVAAQGFTVIAMLVGSMYYNKDREKTKELRQLQEARDAEEKRLKWIRELESRDEEDKAMRASLEKKKQLAAAARAEAAQGAATPTEETTAGTGGALGRMSLWPQGDKKAAEEPAVETASAEPEKKRNPKSSLGDLGDIISSKKKD